MTVQSIKGNIELSKPVAQVMLSACVYNTSLTMPAFLGQPPATSTSTGIACVDTMKRGIVAFMFAGTDTADETVNYQVVGLIPVERHGYGQGCAPLKVATGVATLGTKALGDAGAFVEASTSLVADTITETGLCGLSRVFTPGGNEAAYLLVDCAMFRYVYVQVERGTCATIDVIAVTGDIAGLGADSELLTAVSPLADDPRAVLSCTSSAWATLAIPAGAKKIYFWCAEDVHFVLDNSSGDPAQVGWVAAGGASYDPTCRGRTYLHVKNRASSSNVYLTFKV